MKKSFWNADKILSITAIVLSLGTFIVFIYQTALIREHQYASVLPYLSMGNAGGGTANYTLVLQNNGIGPAIIHSVKTRKDKLEYFEDPYNFLLRVPEADSIDFYYSNLMPGMLIQAGNQVELLGVNNSLDDSDKLRRIVESLDIYIEYESIYGQRWEARYKYYNPRKIN